MTYGICTLSVVPCRKEPSGTSEMVTQLLFGDHYTVIETTENWLKIRIAYDEYECWLSIKQHTKISDSTFKALQKSEQTYSNDLVQIITEKTSGSGFPITIGASLPFLKGQDCSFENMNFHFEGAVSSPSKKQKASSITDTAFLFMNAPYLWGGKSPFGIDCSGFTQLVYKLNGYKIPRDAYQQVEIGTALSFVEEAQAGDLAFFDNEEGRIVHVGIMLDGLQIIHASGKVRIDKLDHYGIFNSDTKRYSHSLRVIKRLLH